MRLHIAIGFVLFLVACGADASKAGKDGSTSADGNPDQDGSAACINALQCAPGVCDPTTDQCTDDLPCTEHSTCGLGAFCNGSQCQPATTGSPCESIDQCIPGESCLEDQCGCEANFIALEPKTANMLILLDRSGTMLDDQRWTQAKDAIAQITQAHQANIRFGLMSFPRGVGVSDCSVGAPQVAPALNTRSAILSAIANDPGEFDGTPMAHALLRIRQDAILSDASFAQYIVLVTDGNPTCLWNDPAYNIDDNNLVGELRRIVLTEVGLLRDGAPGVRTFAVGMGNSYDSAFLNQVAAAGGTGQNTAFDADSLPALTQALSQIAQQAVSCQYELGTTEVPEGASVHVQIGETAINEDPSSGYTIDTASGLIEFHGSACTSLQNAAGEEVRVHIGCNLQVD